MPSDRDLWYGRGRARSGPCALIVETLTDIWKTPSPRDFQIDGDKYLIQPDGPLPRSLLLVRKTGEGKSAVMKGAGTILRGLTVSVVPTLALGSDQFDKIEFAEIDEQHGIKAFHIDDYNKMTADERNRLKDEIFKSLMDTDQDEMPRVFVFISPQSLVNAKLPWGSLFLELARENKFRLFVLDELHQLEQHGLFREGVEKLKENFIQPLISASRRRIRILGMSATMTNDIVERCENLFGFPFSHRIWASPREMDRRAVKVELTCRNSVGYSICPHLKKSIEEHTDQERTYKAIVFTDVKSHIDSLRSSINNALDNIPGWKADCLRLHGDLQTGEKGTRVGIFCGNLHKDDIGKWYPVVVSTSGSGSTGVDPSDLDAVYREGLPPCKTDYQQEMGRLLRGTGSADRPYLYYISINVNSLDAVLCRTYSSSVSAEVKERQVKDQMDVLETLVIGEECYHFHFEKIFGDPARQDDVLPACCDSMCPVCSGSRQKELCVKANLRKLQRTLASLFREKGKIPLHDEFSRQLMEKGKKNNAWTRKKVDKYRVEFLVLQMIAAGLLECTHTTQQVTTGEKKSLQTTMFVQPTFFSDGITYVYTKDESWNRIPNVVRD